MAYWWPQDNWDGNPPLRWQDTSWRRLRDHVAACDLEVVNHHGARLLCRFMYTEHGFAIPTLDDGGSQVHYC